MELLLLLIRESELLHPEQHPRSVTIHPLEMCPHVLMLVCRWNSGTWLWGSIELLMLESSWAPLKFFAPGELKENQRLQTDLGSFRLSEITEGLRGALDQVQS